jgi:uncharacterized protein YajQ (UPF0234 family)
MPSFDVVSKVDLQEVTNAIVTSLKEIGQRYDFKGTKSSIELIGEEIKIISDDDYKLESLKTILLTRLNKRGISPKSLDMQKVEGASGGTVRQMIKIIQGLAAEKAREINRYIKDQKFKVTSETHKDQLRVNGKSRDELQTVMAALKTQDFGPPLQFTNFRD